MGKEKYQLSNLYKLKKKDIDKCAEVSAKAFKNDPMYKYILAEKNIEESRQLFNRFIIKYSILYGKAYAPSSDIEGIILFSDYDDYNINLYRSLRSGALSLWKLGSDVGKRFNKYDQFTDTIHEKVMKEHHQYIIFLCVDPDYQGQGYGKQLLLSALSKARAKGQPTYLETHTSTNVEIYKKLGFEVAAEEIVPGSDVMCWGMIKAL
ncbi:MAG: GNAT family N-acetyltransferase [Halothermotrichaceae bacterium]